MSSSLTTFTLIHVALSLVGILARMVVAGGLIAGKRLDGWTGLFLVTTVLTNVTGFGFPFVVFLPSHGVGILSLVVLPVVIAARYWKNLAGPWRGVYVVGAVLALYLNVFVLVVQLFRRLPALIGGPALHRVEGGSHSSHGGAADPGRPARRRRGHSANERGRGANQARQLPAVAQHSRGHDHPLCRQAAW